MSISDEKLINQIKSLPYFVGAQCHCERISQGLSHRCFIVHCTMHDGQTSTRYFVKYLSDHQATGANERLSSKLASEQLITPEVVYSSVHWLVTAFIDGTTLAASPISDRQKYQIGMKLLAQCHQIIPNQAMASLSIGGILEQQISSAQLSKNQLECLTNISQQVLNFDERGSPVLCHGDANFANIIISPTHHAWLVDFECSFIGYREFDIAMFIAINQLAISHLTQVLQAYQQSSSYTLDIDLVRAYLPCCYLINGLWYFNNGNNSQDQDAYRPLAAKQFQCFDQLAITPHQLAPMFSC